MKTAALLLLFTVALAGQTQLFYFDVYHCYLNGVQGGTCPQALALLFPSGEGAMTANFTGLCHDTIPVGSPPTRNIWISSTAQSECPQSVIIQAISKRYDNKYTQGGWTQASIEDPACRKPIAFGYASAYCDGSGHIQKPDIKSCFVCF